MSLGIYIHIPFCVRKCPYCDFTSFPAETVPEKKYLDALKKEMGSRVLKASFCKEINTVYIGGGTPSLFSPIIIENILSCLLKKSSLSRDIEITIEVNPGTVNYEKLKGFRDAGVNRLSLGIQSLNDRFLTALGRIHNRQEAMDAYDFARRAGFENIGIDLIYSKPGESLSDWEEDLNEAISLRPDHISAYNLTVEEDTRFFYQQGKGLLNLPSEEAQVEMFTLTTDILEKAGYVHYEVSNYALPGFRSRHNQIYWKGGDYLGLGVSAHSHIKGDSWRVRQANSSNLEEYFGLINEKGNAIVEEEVLTKEKGMGEYIFLGLRMMEGIDLEAFKERFGTGIETAFQNEINELAEKGLLEMAEGHLRLTKRGLLLLNEVSVRFV